MKNVIAAAMIAAVGASASAATLYATSFEAPTFAVGALNLQDGWTAASSPASLFQVNGAAGFARTGSQFVFANTANQTSTGSNWNFRPTIVAPVTAPNSTIRASVWTAVLNNTTAAVGRQSAGGIDLYDDTGSVRLGAMRVRNDGAVVLINSAGASGTLGAGSVTANAYNQVTIEADFAAQKVRWFINGIQIDTSGLGATFGNFSATGFGDADLYAVRTNTQASGTSGGHTVLFDDFSVDAVPTPGALSVLGLAGLIAARRRRA